MNKKIIFGIVFLFGLVLFSLDVFANPNFIVNNTNCIEQWNNTQFTLSDSPEPSSTCKVYLTNNRTDGGVITAFRLSGSNIQQSGEQFTYGGIRILDRSSNFILPGQTVEVTLGIIPCITALKPEEDYNLRFSFWGDGVGRTEVVILNVSFTGEGSEISGFDIQINHPLETLLSPPYPKKLTRSFNLTNEDFGPHPREYYITCGYSTGYSKLTSNYGSDWHPNAACLEIEGVGEKICGDSLTGRAARTYVTIDPGATITYNCTINLAYQVGLVRQNGGVATQHCSNEWHEHHYAIDYGYQFHNTPEYLGTILPSYSPEIFTYRNFNPGESLFTIFNIINDNETGSTIPPGSKLKIQYYWRNETGDMHFITEQIIEEDESPDSIHETTQGYNLGNFYMDQDFQGNKWYRIFATVRNASDGMIFMNASTAFRIGSAPFIGSSILKSIHDTNYTTENLTAYVSGLGDAENDPVKIIPDWRVDDESITVLNMPFEGNHFDKTFVRDYSGKENHGNTSSLGFGNDRWNRTAGFDGFGAFRFDGIIDLDYIQIPTSPSLNFGPSDSFTMSAWVKPTSSEVQNIMSKLQGGSFYEMYLNVLNYPICKYSNGTETLEVASSVIAPNDEWTNIVCVRDTTNEELRIYIDGVSRGVTTSPNVNINLHNTGDLYIGANGAANTNFFDGYIDHVQIYKRALSPEQIELMYNHGVTRQLAAYWPADGNMLDAVGGYDGTIFSNVSYNTEGKFGSAFDFNGEDGFVDTTMGSNDAFTSPEGFTLAAWIKPDESGSFSNPRILDKSTGGLALEGFYLSWQKDLNRILFRINEGTGISSETNSVPAGDWSFVVVTVTGGSLVTHYVDGVQSGTSGTTGTDITTSSPLTIGNRAGATDRSFKGLIDDVRVYKKVLSPEQIKLLYSNGPGFPMHDKETRAGEKWSLNLTPNDGFYDGASISSNTLEIRNRVPTHSPPILNSSWGTNYTFENLTVHPQDTSDLDPEHNVSGGIKNIFNWFVDGNSITVLNMPFEGGSNSTWTKDYSGNNYDGIVSGATWNRTGGYDEKGAYEFDGVNSYIDTSIVSNDYFTSSDGFTLSVWIYALDSSTSWTRIIDKSDGINASNGFTFSFIPEFKRIAFRINEGDIIFSEDDSIILENWHHVSASVNQSGNITLYIDGIKSGAPGYSNDLNSIISSNKLRLGNWAYNLNRPFNGSISEVQIYNRALSPEQIKALYENRTDLIVSHETRIGEVWHAEVTPNDGFDDGATLSSNNIPIEACDEWIDGLGCVDCDLSYEGRLCERNPGDILTISGYCAMNTSSIGDWYCDHNPVWANWTVNYTNFDYETHYVADECAHMIGYDLFGCRQNFTTVSNYTREGTCIQEECCLDIVVSGEPKDQNRPADPNWRDGNELCGCNNETAGMFCDANPETEIEAQGVCIFNSAIDEGTCCEFDNIIYANKTTEELAANKFQLDGTERCGGDCAFINEACSIDFTRGLLWEGACLPSEGGLQCLPKPVSDCDLSFIDNNCGSILLNMTCNASLEKVSFEYYGDAWITITSDINREGHDWLTLWHTQNIPDKTYQVRATAWDFVGGIAYSEKNIPVNNSNLTKPVIEFPSPGSVVNGTFNIEFSGASTYAEIQFDGGNFSPTTTLSTHLWNTTEFTDSTHTIRIRADDENCGWIYSDYLTVEVDNSREGIHILTPRDNEIISGDYQVEIMGPSWAREVLIYVENSTGKFALDGSPGYTTDSDGSDGFNQIWETAEFADGTYTITANATRRIFFGLNSYTVTATRFNITIDNAAVQPPSNLRVYDHPYDNDGIINLEWDLSTTPNVIAYNIYRDVMPDFNIIPSKLIATVDSTTNTYTETLPDGTYYWAVTALTPASESSPSNYNYTTIDTVLPVGTLWANQTYIKDGDNITYKYIGDEINYVVTLDTTIYDNEGEIISLLDDGVLPDEVAGDAVYTGNSTMISGKPDGNYTVTAVVNDSTNLFYPKTSIIVDNTEPFASIQILSKGIPGFQEQNPAFTATRDVILNLSFSDNYEVKDCRYKNEDPDFTNINWEPCVITKEWLLIDQDGSRTVYYQVRDKAGNINTTFDSIYLNKTGAGVDVTPPEGLIVVDQGPYTKHNSWLYAYWHNASDHENELLNLPLTYKYRIINNDTELNITEWIDVGTSTEVNHTGLNLADNTTYAFEVAVFNAANLNQTEQSSGVKVDTTLPEITDITAYNADNLSEEIPADTWVPIRNILFNFTGYDNISGVNAFSYLLDDNPAYSPGIVSYWRAEGNALDSVGSNHGTLMNNVSFTEGISGQAFEFDDGRVDTFNLNDMHPENFTISFWVKNKVLDNEGIHPRPFHGGATGSTTSQNAGFSFRLQGDNKEDVAFLVRHPSEEIEHGKTVVTHLGHDSWTFITGTKEQLKINLYKNGSLVGSEELEHIEYRRNFLMHVGGTGNFYFNGSIDEIAIFNRAISSKEALQFYSAQSPYFLGPDNIWEVQVSNQTEEHSSVTYRNLEDGIYYFMVKALDAAGNWGFYDIYKIKIDATPPTKPTILDKTLSSDGTSLNVSWSESTALSGIDVYHIEVLNSSGEIISSQTNESIPGSQRDYLISGLTPGQEYKVVVRARSNSGLWSLWSDEIPVDTREPEVQVDDMVPSDTSNVLAGEQVFYIRTNQTAICEYKIEDEPYRQFRFTNSTYHEDMRTVTTNFKWYVRCTTLDGVNESEHDATVYVSTEISDPEVTIKTPNIYSGQKFLAEISTGLGGLPKREFTIKLNKTEVDIDEVSIVDVGGGNYQLTMRAPETPNTYNLTININEASAGKIFNVLPLKFSVKYSGDSEDSSSYSRIIAGKSGNITLGIASSSESEISTDEFSLNSTIIQTEGYIFVTPSADQLRTIDRNLRTGRFKDLAVPSFGERLGRENSIYAFLEYDNIIINKEEGVQAGSQNLIIRNNGLTADGKVNITIRVG